MALLKEKPENFFDAGAERKTIFFANEGLRTQIASQEHFFGPK